MTTDFSEILLEVRKSFPDAEVCGDRPFTIVSQRFGGVVIGVSEWSEAGAWGDAWRNIQPPPPVTDDSDDMREAASSERNISLNYHVAKPEQFEQIPSTDAGRSLLATMVQRRDAGSDQFASAYAAYRHTYSSDAKRIAFERAYGVDHMDVRPVSFTAGDLDRVAATCANDPLFVEFR